MSIVKRAPRAERRRLERMARKSKDPDEVRRALGVRRLMEGFPVSEVASALAAARSAVYRWAAWYREYGIEGLFSEVRGRPRCTVNDALVEAVLALLDTTPQALGYLRSNWSSELLAKALEEQYRLSVHASTVRRLLPKLGFGWRRARPTLCKRDPRKSVRIKAINAALANADPHTEVFYVDEADIDLNPRIGYSWRRRGHQLAVPTPGTNRKNYIAGALHAHTGRVVWVDHERKDTALFLSLLRTLRRTYRRAQRIVLIVDNYRPHLSALTNRWLALNPKFELLFQPAWHPWVNEIERLWKQLHDNVTRNHRCQTLRELMKHVARFLDVVQPFPGSSPGLATMFHN